MKRYNQISGQRVQRIEAISDGVFAIALTLLIFNIKVPISQAIDSEKDLMYAFGSLAPSLLSYFLSFMTLGIYWSAQSTQFHYISKSDRNSTWINLFFLLFVSTIPFTTAFLSQYITFKFAIGVYWLNIFLLGYMLAVHLYYADKHNFIELEESEKSTVRKAIKRRIIEAQSLYTFGALLCFINTYLSIIALILIQLNYALALSSKLLKYLRNRTKH
jgi:uncharacterized membrane protein